ncbi:MAG: ATP-binding protein [Candidatus Lambdaproteobacteria bacterium]|nr:ATP-binding protein [Candidatus Lambdaproteobacteria bacterium]
MAIASRWDAEKIDAVLEELPIHAIRATPDRVSVRSVARSEGGPVEFRVIDRGAGVPPEEQERIFEPFVTLADPMTHSSGMPGDRAQGVGMGLTRATARLHGGTLTLETTGARGSTFPLRLPRVAPTFAGRSGRA